MIGKLKILRAEGLYPYRNQAIEKSLLENCRQGEMILYLWANDKTVFLGKNQNAYTECRLSDLLADGGHVARRFTGGGAVYHDKGNLNFTFIAPHADYEIQNQFTIIMNAMRSLGINATLSGRNDVLVDGKKFSGNAFFKSERNCLHHGTILIESDYAAIEKYLNVSPVKLHAKGVKSVSSRVANLCEFSPGINADMVSEALQEAFKAHYPAAEVCLLQERELSEEELAKLTKRFADEKYILGDNVQYDVSFENRYEWGVADIRLEMNGERIVRARIYSDALDTEAVELKERLLAGTDLNGPVDGRVKDIIETMMGDRK